MKILPACYFPTTIIFVDDSESYLKNIRLRLNSDRVCLLFSNPIEAIEYVRKHKSKFDLKKYLNPFESEERYGQNSHPFNLRLNPIQSKIFDKERFGEIAIIVVDYSMPTVDGISLAKELADTSVKIIMLTGEADNSTAIKTLNQKIIDTFIFKNDPNIESTLNNSITELECKYFEEQTDFITKPLSSKAYSFLNDPIFMEKFYDILNENQIVEYYLTDDAGGYLMANKQGKVFRLVILNDEDLCMYFDFAQDSQVSPMLLEQIKKGEKIPYFDVPKDLHNIKGELWSQYCHTAEKLNGNTAYYYSFFEELNLSSPIYAYEKYMEKIDHMI